MPCVPLSTVLPRCRPSTPRRPGRAAPAVVGRLGAAALAVGGVVLVQVATQLTFLSYGTTARTARLYGSGQRAAAVAQGAQASWMRGVQDTTRPLRYILIGNGISVLLCPVLVHGAGPVAGMGLPGSAVANVVAQVLAAGLFLRALGMELTAERAPPWPSWPAMCAQLGMGRDLVLRAAAFQACFLSATSVVARTSAATAGAHQVVLQLWSSRCSRWRAWCSRWTGCCWAPGTRRFCAPRP
jgi:Na+-driven multidrug efflux pump